MWWLKYIVVIEVYCGDWNILCWLKYIVVRKICCGDWNILWWLKFIVVMQIYCNDELFSSIVNDGIREFYIFLRKNRTCTKSTKIDFLHLRCFYTQKAQKIQKAQKAQQATFFILNVFMRTKSTKSARHQTSGLVLFMRI